MRSFTPIEIAIGVALVGSVSAVAIPAFVREVHASRFVEPTDALHRMGTAAVVYAEENQRFPDSAPLTPNVPPRGTKEVDPPGTWDGPTWTALAFRPVPDKVPHAYSYAFDSQVSTFTGRARGDLDGDGVLSTFEIRGSARPGEVAHLEPGMVVDSELE